MYVPRREASRGPVTIRPSPTLDTDMKAGAGGAGGPALAGIRVVVAEDEAVIALDLEETLHALGCAVRTAVSSGAEALDLVRRERPDVVLLDLGLADGFAGPLAAALRAEACRSCSRPATRPSCSTIRRCVTRRCSRSRTSARSWYRPWPD